MEKTKITKRVEKHRINKGHPYYKMLDDFCFKSKNLYNFANYQIRQQFIKDNKFLNYCNLDKLLKTKDMDFDYRNMCSAVASQQLLKLLEKNWKSFFKSIKDWSKNKEKYKGRPKLPGYIDKDGRNLVVLTYTACKIKDGLIHFPKTFQGFTLKTNVINLQQVRILPRTNHFVIELVYNIPITKIKQDNVRYLGIDIGLDNLATVCNNVGVTPFIISGREIKSINQYYNKQKAHYQEIAERMNKTKQTARLERLTRKRTDKIDTLLHTASKKIIDEAVRLKCNTIVIGKNKQWKTEINIGKVNNQKFVIIPHARFIEMIKYKAEHRGIKCIETEESYTSSTSFLDNETPIKENYNKKRRITRGLFKANDGTIINADLNGAYQITKKIFPDAFIKKIKHKTHPIRIKFF